MLKNLLLKSAMLAALTVVVLAAAACSTVPAPLQQPFITAAPSVTSTPTAMPTEPSSTVTPQASSRQSRNPNALANLPANLRALGLEGGVVAANSGNSLSLKLGKATAQLNVAPSTIVVVPGQKNAALADVRVGDRVIAHVPESDANAPASIVLDFPQGYTAANVAAGLVTGRATGGFTVRARGGDRTISADTSTLIVTAAGGQPRTGTAADLKRGSPVLVIGQGSSDSFTAQVIVVLDRNALQHARNRNLPAATPTPLNP